MSDLISLPNVVLDGMRVGSRNFKSFVLLIKLRRLDGWRRQLDQFASIQLSYHLPYDHRSPILLLYPQAQSPLSDLNSPLLLLASIHTTVKQGAALICL
ncbi:hypothetical protein FGO68_gene569 [Halteria grandinella]|uniref:Uncharacterized protein n=1 Tax=Halteria grandinella TaxID=5974 RepID=A0A8J8NQ57_HALGN|nr:hypothetical protein FGO68_gene569 [Halteria grandinella]